VFSIELTWHDLRLIIFDFLGTLSQGGGFPEVSAYFLKIAKKRIRGETARVNDFETQVHGVY
jgi:hypothetical protein